MTGNDLIRELSRLRPELREKEICIIAENGMHLEPKIKFVQKKDIPLDMSVENIEKVVLTWG